MLSGESPSIRIIAGPLSISRGRAIARNARVEGLDESAPLDRRLDESALLIERRLDAGAERRSPPTRTTCSPRMFAAELERPVTTRTCELRRGHEARRPSLSVLDTLASYARSIPRFRNTAVLSNCAEPREVLGLRDRVPVTLPLGERKRLLRGGAEGPRNCLRVIACALPAQSCIVSHRGIATRCCMLGLSRPCLAQCSTRRALTWAMSSSAIAKCDGVDPLNTNDVRLCKQRPHRLR